MIPASNEPGSRACSGVVDLSSIKIDASLGKDLEQIAQNTHETWAMQRKLRGWEYGEVYDEAERKHPCMIEYENLPELKKDMDRETVIQTVKMLFWMGYSIEKRG